MSWVTEKPIFPMKVVTVSQPHGVGSHIGQYAVDFVGTHKNYPVFAPYTCKIIYREGYSLGNTVFLVSTDDKGNIVEVELPNGNKSVVTTCFIHSNKDENYFKEHYEKGTVFQYGTSMYSTGESGIAYGDHLHLQVGLGESYGWNNNNGIYNLNNELRVDEVFHYNQHFHEFINSFGHNGKYNFKEIGDENWFPPTDPPIDPPDLQEEFYFDVRKRRVRMI